MFTNVDITTCLCGEPLRKHTVQWGKGPNIGKCTHELLCDGNVEHGNPDKHLIIKFPTDAKGDFAPTIETIVSVVRRYEDTDCPNCYGGHFRPCQMCGDTGHINQLHPAPKRETI